VDVHGVAFYIAWSLIGLALISEAAATLVHWRRHRAGPDGLCNEPGSGVSMVRTSKPREECRCMLSSPA
jgi:hypothetical protein